MKALKGLKRLKNLSIVETPLDNRKRLLRTLVGQSCKLDNQKQTSLYVKFFIALAIHFLFYFKFKLTILLSEWYFSQTLTVDDDIIRNVLAFSLAFEYIILGLEEFCVLVNFYPSNMLVYFSMFILRLCFFLLIRM
jgi:hypothetical protein